VQILSGLYLGSLHDSSDAAQLTQNSITHIVSVHDTAMPLRSVSHMSYSVSVVVVARVVSAEISSWKFIPIFPEISGKFPDIFTENFPPVQTCLIVYLLAYPLSIGFYSTSDL